jgi:hypothetical protein
MNGRINADLISARAEMLVEIKNCTHRSHAGGGADAEVVVGT